MSAFSDYKLTNRMFAVPTVCLIIANVIHQTRKKVERKGRHFNTAVTIGQCPCPLIRNIEISKAYRRYVCFSLQTFKRSPWTCLGDPIHLLKYTPIIIEIGSDVY